MIKYRVQMKDTRNGEEFIFACNYEAGGVLKAGILATEEFNTAIILGISEVVEDEA